ncbi:MAG TPA: hypothetical protein VJ438_04105 [Candidatus Nanoarchaeia archaeon]|nr:hypothetical protein [Candidatus Nanoarchaeia archaeon]
MFSKEELEILKKINTPSKIQDFLNSLKTNFELNGDTCSSPRKVLREGHAHCMEGAILAAAILRLQGFKPLIVDLETNKDDYDHAIAVFNKDGFWGALSKTNHAVLRYREPVYKSIRELVMSFFHEYFLDSNGKKTLRRFSMPVDLSRFDKFAWEVSEEDVWYIPEYLVEAKHFDLLTRSQIASLRKADEIEIKAGSIRQYKAPDGFVEPLYRKG